MMDKLRLGFIGCGGMAGAHLKACGHLREKGVDTVELAAFCDADLNRASQFAEQAKKFQPETPTRTYAEFERMLDAERLDAVTTCLPHFLHHSIAIACMERGLHVLAEKPLAVTVKAGWQMVKTAERTGRILATATQVRRWVGPRAVHWAIHEARLLGAPRFAFISYTAWRGKDPAEPIRDSVITWRQNKLTGGGGPTMDSGVHVADLLIHLFGEPSLVFGQTDNLASQKWPDGKGGFATCTAEDTMMATIVFKSGVRVMYVMTAAAPGRPLAHNAYYGSHGSIYAESVYPQKPQLTLWDKSVREPQQFLDDYMNSLTPERKERLFPRGIMEGVALEIHDFVDAIRHNRPPAIDGLQGLKAQALSEAIYESSFCRQAVAYDDVLSGKVAAFQAEIDEKWGI